MVDSSIFFGSTPGQRGRELPIHPDDPLPDGDTSVNMVGGGGWLRVDLEAVAPVEIDLTGQPHLDRHGTSPGHRDEWCVVHVEAGLMVGTEVDGLAVDHRRGQDM